MQVKFRLSQDLIEKFPTENHLYNLIMKDNKYIITWVEDGEIEENVNYSIKEVEENFADGFWVKVES